MSIGKFITGMGKSLLGHGIFNIGIHYSIKSGVCRVRKEKLIKLSKLKKK